MISSLSSFNLISSLSQSWCKRFCEHSFSIRSQHDWTQAHIMFPDRIHSQTVHNC